MDVLTPTLGPNFSATALRSDEECWFVESGGLRVTDLGLEKCREVHGRTMVACEIAVDLSAQLAYFSDGGLRALDLRSGGLRTVTTAADVAPNISGVTASTTPEHPESVLSPRFQWHLRLSPAGDEIVCYLATWRVINPDTKHEALDQVVVVGAADGKVRSQFEINHVDAGLAVDFVTRRVCLPRATGGPEVVDFAGRGIQKVPQSTEHFRCTRSSFSPMGRSIALGGTSGLLLWDLSTNGVDAVDSGPACNPVWRPNSSEIWYTRGEDELWFVSQARAAEPVISTAAIPTRGTAARHPWFSPDGRYCIVELNMSATAGKHKPQCFVVDAVQRIVHHVPRLCTGSGEPGSAGCHSAAWCRRGGAPTATT